MLSPIKAINLFNLKAEREGKKTVNLTWETEGFPEEVVPIINREIKEIVNEEASKHGALGIDPYKIVINDEEDLELQTKRIPSRRTQLITLYRNTICGENNIYTADTPLFKRAIGPYELQSDTLHLILKHFPQPSKDTTWESLFEFKSDQESKQSLLALRRWVRKNSIGSLSGAELEEEIEYLISEFERLYKLHEIQFYQSPIERFICNTSEIIEDIVKLRLSSATSKLFQIRKGKTDYLIRSSKLDGYDLRYISHVKKEFGDT